MLGNYLSRLRLISVILVGGLFSACSEQPDPERRPISTSDDAQSLCFGMRTDNRYERVPYLPKPAYLSPYKDPVFGAKITRISQAANGETIKPMYSTIQSWNADESLLILYHTGSAELGHYLYDGATYTRLRRLNITTANLEEVFWHHSDPSIFFYISAGFSDYGALMSYDVSTDTSVEIANFSAVCGDGELVTAGNSIAMPSLDDTIFGFRCTSTEQSLAFSYNRQTDKISLLEIGEGTQYAPWDAPAPSPSGEFFYLNGDILNTALDKNISTLDVYEYHSHSSLGRQSNGSDALFATAFDFSPKGCDGAIDGGHGALIVHDLATGNCRAVIEPSTGFGDPVTSTHVSALASAKPGWVAMSSVGTGQLNYLTNNKPAKALFSEIYLVNTAENKTELCRLAHHRSHGKKGDQGYFAEPHVTLSPSGTRLMFGSDWYNSGAVDTYVIDLRP